MRKLVFISTHLINGAVISEYIKMSKVKDVDCILAIDNSNLKIEILNLFIKLIFSSCSTIYIPS